MVVDKTIFGDYTSTGRFALFKDFNTLLTDEQIRERHLARCRDLENRYGSLFDAPLNEMNHLRELMRAEHVAQLHYANSVSHPLHKTLRDYGVSTSIIEEMTGVVPVIEHRVKRADKYKVLLSWCDSNPGKLTNAKEISEVGEMSISTATTFIKDRPDYFKRVKRGEYIIRNPAAERADDK